MTRDELKIRVEHWRQRLLPEWRVLLFDEPPPWAEDEDREYNAIVQTAEDYLEARIFFTDEALDRDAPDVEVTIVHELLHPAMRELRGVIDRVQLHPAEAGSVLSALSSAEERVVDRLSRAIVALDRDDTDLGPTTSLGPRGRKQPDVLDVVDQH